MIIGYSPMLSVFYATVLAFAMSALAPDTALGPRKLLIAILVIGAGAAALFTITPIGGTAFSIEFETYFALLILVLIGLLAFIGLTPAGQRWVPSSKKLTAAMLKSVSLSIPRPSLKTNASGPSSPHQGYENARKTTASGIPQPSHLCSLR